VIKQSDNQTRSFLVAISVGVGSAAMKAVAVFALVLSSWQSLYAFGWLTVVALYGRNAKDLPLSQWMLGSGSNQLLVIAGVFGLLVVALAVVQLGSLVMWLAMEGGWQPSQNVLNLWNAVHKWQVRQKLSGDNSRRCQKES
jgi:hypothetical protein